MLMDTGAGAKARRDAGARFLARLAGGARETTFVYYPGAVEFAHADLRIETLTSAPRPPCRYCGTCTSGGESCPNCGAPRG